MGNQHPAGRHGHVINSITGAIKKKIGITKKKGKLFSFVQGNRQQPERGCRYRYESR